MCSCLLCSVESCLLICFSPAQTSEIAQGFVNSLSLWCLRHHWCDAVSPLGTLLPPARSPGHRDTHVLVLSRCSGLTRLSLGNVTSWFSLFLIHFSLSPSFLLLFPFPPPSSRFCILLRIKETFLLKQAFVITTCLFFPSVTSEGT